MWRVCIPCFLLFVAIAAAGGQAASAAAPQHETGARAAAKAVAVAIRDQADGQLAKFYATRGFWPLWASTGRIGREAEALLGYLATAELDGLKPESYRLGDLRVMIREARSGDPVRVATAEIGLSRAFARYAADMRRPGKVKMTWLDRDLKPKALSAKTILRAAALRSSLPRYVADMGWMSPHYARLRKLLAMAERQGAPKDDLKRIRLNLDRARLLPSAWSRHVVVDAASARLFYYEGGKQQGMMRVVAGTPETPTPMLAGKLRYAILNPYWNVPNYMTRKKFAPKMLDGATAQSLRLEALSDWSDSPRPLDPATIDWAAVAAGREKVRLRQLPGGDNAMGRVKFIFPNDQGIYLHDTPDKKLLARADRHLSNGCVRLEDATRLGSWLFGKPLRAASKTPEQAVPLPMAVPVYLTYLTATPKAKGFGFLADVYDRDG